MYRKRSRDQEIREVIDGEIMDWDLQEFCWESSTDLDPKDDRDHQLASDHNHDHHLVVLDFTNSDPQKTTSPTSEPNSRLITCPTMAHEPENLARVSAVDSSPSSGTPPKRLITSGAQKMSCSVDGCKADLSGCRDYHRRHRVCERHSKTPIVIVKGEEKRFCQQCSRFHSLGEFDEVKRSCRKRLDGHNRRRRKSQPEPLYFNSKNFLSGYKGPRILHFGNPQIYATASVRTMWPTETKSGSESWLYGPHRRFQVINQQSPQISFNGTSLKKNISLKSGFSYQTNSNEQFLCHPFEPPGRGRNNNRMIMMSSSDEEISLPIDSGGRALCLLSTNPTPQQLVQQPNESCSFQLLDYNSKDKPLLDPLPTPTYYCDIANKTNDSNDMYARNMMLRMGPDGLLEHGALQMLPISLE